MSESVPNQQESPAKTILFMVVLSLVCALILSVLASVLKEPKEIAKNLDRNKQLMIAAKILSHQGYFLTKDKEENYVPANVSPDGILVATEKPLIPSQAQLLEVYKNRLEPIFTNDKGEIKNLKEIPSLNYEEYLSEYKKSGYYKQPWKLLYKIYSNTSSDPYPIGYVIPVNGYGLWDAIYGYIAIKPDGDKVMGISWYDQKETPGLGANITEESWQKLFHNKDIFQPSPDGKTDFKTASLGITVVKGKVADVYGDSPKSLSAVDGMAGATLTGNGVTDAYREVLAAYRPFLVKLHESYQKEQDKEK